MMDAGLIERSGTGFFYLLPLAMRSLNKLEGLISEEIENLGAQKILCPSLGPKSLWETAGRWDLMQQDMFRLSDRNNVEFCLR